MRDTEEAKKDTEGGTVVEKYDQILASNVWSSPRVSAPALAKFLKRMGILPARDISGDTNGYTAFRIYSRTTADGKTERTWTGE